MQVKPTQQQVMNAFAVIENVDADDAMALLVYACVAADKHNKLDEVATNIESDYEELFDRMHLAFDAFN